MSFQANQFHGETKGLLTLHGITKEIILNVEFGGTNTDPWGSIKA